MDIKKLVQEIQAGKAWITGRMAHPGPWPGQSIEDQYLTVDTVEHETIHVPHHLWGMFDVE